MVTFTLFTAKKKERQTTAPNTHHNDSIPHAKDTSALSWAAKKTDNNNTFMQMLLFL